MIVHLRKDSHLMWRSRCIRFQLTTAPIKIELCGACAHAWCSLMWSQFIANRRIGAWGVIYTHLMIFPISDWNALNPNHLIHTHTAMANPNMSRGSKRYDKLTISRLCFNLTKYNGQSMAGCRRGMIDVQFICRKVKRSKHDRLPIGISFYERTDWVDRVEVMAHPLWRLRPKNGKLNFSPEKWD